MSTFTQIMNPSYAAVQSDINDSSRIGAAMASQLIAGLGGGTQQMYQTGAALANTLIGGIGSQFGPSGTAVAHLSRQLTQTLGGVISASFDALGTLAGAGGRLVGMGVGFATAGVGALIGSLAGPAGTIAGAVIGSTIGLLGMKTMAAVTDVFGGIAGAAGKAAGEIGKMFVETLRAGMDILSDLSTTLLSQTKTILSLSQQSGLSIDASNQAVMTGMAFGITPQQSGHMFSQNVMFQRPMAAAWAVHGEPGSPEYYRSFRNQYQGWLGSLGGNPLIANMMASSMGKEALIPMANLPTPLFNRQLQTSQAMQSAFGMKPSDIQQAQQNLAMLIASFDEGVMLLKTRVATELLPELIKGLDYSIGWVKEHSGEIGGWIKTGVESAVHYATVFGKFMVSELPFMLISAGKYIANGVGLVSEAAPILFNSLKEGVQGLIPTFKGVLDVLKEIGGYGSAVKSAGHFVRTMGGLRPATSGTSASVGGAGASGGAGVGSAGGGDSGSSVTDGLWGIGALWAGSKLLPMGAKALVNALGGGAGAHTWGSRGLAYNFGRVMGRGLAGAGRAALPLLLNPFGIAGLAGGALIGGGLMYRNKVERDRLQAENDRVAAYQATLIGMSSDERRAKLFGLPARSAASSSHTNPILNTFGLKTPEYKEGSNMGVDWSRRAFNWLDDKEKQLGSPDSRADGAAQMLRLQERTVNLLEQMVRSGQTLPDHVTNALLWQLTDHILGEQVARDRRVWAFRG